MKPKFSLVRVRASRRSFIPSILAAALALALGAKPAQAASSSWLADAAGNWNATGSWNATNGIPGSTTTDNADIATFNNLLTAARTVTVDTNRYIGGITFGATNTSTFGYTLQTGTLRLQSGGIIQTTGAIGVNTNTISSPLVISGTSAATASFTASPTTAANGVISITGGVTGSATATNTTTLTLNGTGTGANAVASIIGNGSGGGNLALVKSGAGTWTLSGANGYSGGTTLSGGTLVITNATSLGTDAVTVSGAASTLRSTGGITYGNAIAVNIGLTLSTPTTGSSTSTFSGALSGSSAITLANNSLAGSAMATFAFTNASNTFTGNVVLPTATGSSEAFSFASIGDGGNITFNRPSWRQMAIYTGAAPITFTTRQITLTTAIGTTTSGINGDGNPVLQFSNNAATAANAVTFNSNMGMPASSAGSTFFTFGGSNTGDNSFAGVIGDIGGANTLGILKWDAGKWILSNASNSYEGNTFIANGTLSAPSLDITANNQPIGKGSLILLGQGSNNGTLEITGSGTSSTNKQVQIGNATAGNTGAGSILNNGSGTVTFSNANFNPAITGITATRTLTIGGSGTGGVNEIQGIIRENATATTGVVALTKSGASTWLLSGANSYTGLTTVSAGTLRAGSNTAFGTTAGGVSITSGAVVDLNGSAIGAEAFTLNGTGISSSGALTNSSSTAASVGGAVTMGSASSIVPGSGNITLSSTLGMSTFALTKGGANTLTLSGVVSGTTANGSTSMTINAGTFILGNTANTFTGNVVVDGASTVLQINGATRNATSGPLGIFTGGLSYKTVTLSNGAIFRPNVTYDPGVSTASLPGNGQIFSIAASGGTFDVPTGVTFTVNDGSGTGVLVANAQLQGSGTLTKTGDGTLALGNGTSNFSTSFTGAIVISAGTLTTGTASTNPFGSVGAGTSISAGATLNTAGIVVDELEPLTLAGTGLTATPAGALTSSTGTGQWAGPITIASGGATIGGGGGALTLNTSATINTAGNTLTLSHVTGNQTFNGVISGNGNVVVTGSGGGIVVPAAAHTYTGGTSLNSGTVAIGIGSTGSAGSPTDGPFGAGATPLILNGAQLRSGTAGPFTIGNTITIAADTTFFTSASEKSLIFSGPVTITGASRTITSTVGTTVAGTGAFFNGAIGDGSNGFGLTKAGTGNLTLGGTNTYTGVTGVTGGNLFVTGSLANNSGLSVTPVVSANISFINNAANTPANFNSLSLGSATGPTAIGLELGASTATSDSISTSAAATTVGTVNLNIMALAGFGTASSYDLISAASGLDGATYVLTSAPGGFTYSLTPGASLVTLNVTPTTAGALYWRGNNGNSWSSFTGVNTNWYTDAAGITNAQANPGAGDTVIFSTTNTFGPVISTTLDNNFTVKKVNFSSSPSGVTAVNVAGGLTPAAVPGVLTIAPTSSGDGISVASDAGAVTISAPVLLGTNQTWTVDGTGANGSALTVSGAVTGAGTLDINGLVTLSAPGTSNYSGATTVPSGSILRGGATNSFSSASAVTVNDTGILRLNGISNTVPSLAGSGIVQNNHASTGATLTVGDATNTTFSGTLQNGAAGTLALAKTGAGIFILSGANTYTGGTTITTGTIQQGVANALPSGRALTVNGTSFFDLNELNASISTLGGAATGTVTDNAAGTGTSTLSITAAGSSPVIIANGATRTVALRVTNELGNFLLSNGSNTFSGGIVLTNSTGGTRMAPGVVTAGAYGTGAITIGESPTDLATIYFANTTSLTNPIVFNTALGADRVGVRVDATVTLSGQLTANLAPVTFATNGTGTLNATGKITGPAGLVLTPNPYDLASARALTVNLNNTAGTNDYEGDTIVNLNPLLLKNTTLALLAADQIPNGTGKGNVIVNSNGTGIGQLSLAGFDETINGLSGNGNVVNSLVGTYTLTLGDNNANGNHTGAINNTVGTLNVTKIGSGIQTFASPVGVGGSNFAGALTVNGGLVAFPSSPAIEGPLGNSTVVNLNGGGLSYTGSTSNALNRTVAIGAGAGTFDVTSLAGTLTVPGADVTSTAGNLVKTGPGTLSLSGTTTLNGGLASVVVSAGRLQAGFGSAGIATINVGAAGNLSLQNSAIQNLALANTAGALTIAGGARLGFECDGTTNDSIAVGATGTPAMAAGVITLDLINFGAGVANGNTYTLLTTTVGDLTNAGATTYALGNAPSGFNYTVNVSSTAVSVTVSAFSPAYWTNSQSSGSWATLNAGPLSNFSTDVAGLTNLAALPGSNETVSLSSSIIAGPTVATTLDGNFTLYGLNFIAGSGTVTTVSVDQGSSGTLTIRPSAVAGGIDVGTNAGNVTIGAPMVASSTNSATQTWNVDGTGANGSSLTLNGVTTFTANVIKTGAGVLTLGNAGNTGAGNFTLAAGTLSISDAGNLPTGVLTIGAGTTINNTGVGTVLLPNSAYTWNGDFTLTGQSLDQGLGAVTLGATTQATVVTNTLTVGGAIDDGAFTYGITKAGAGTLVLSGTSTYGGVTSVTAGTLNLTGSLTGGGAVATSGTGILSESSLGVISGASTVTQASPGTSVLAGTNTYSGLTTITSGVLRITNASALGATAAGTTQSGTSALELDGSGGAFTVGAEPLTINGGGVSGSDGALRNIAGNNIYGGTVTMTAQSRINSDAGTLTLINSTSVTGVAQSLQVGGAGNVTISGAIATTTGGVTKDGIGALTLGGTNAYTGNTTLSAGVINITGSITGNGTTTNLVYGNSTGNTIVNVSGSINNYKNFQGANISGSVAVMNQTGGSTTTLGTNGGDTQWVAQNGGYGYLNIIGGVFNTGRFDAVAPLGGGGTAVIYVGGMGAFNNNVGDWLILPRTNGTGQLTVGPGGSLVRTAAVTSSLALTMDGADSHGTLNVAGGTVDTGVRPLQFGFGSSAASTGNRGFVNVASGTLSVGAAINQTNTTALASYFDYFNFAGGTVRSNAAITWLPATSANQHTLAATLYGPVTNNNNANTAFNTQIGAASNFSGGLTVDTNGFPTTIAYPLSAATGFGVTQDNVGDLSLRVGNSGYIGAPAVVFSPPAAAGIPASGYAVINAGTGQVTGIVITNPGVYASGEQPTITLTGGGGSIAPFQTSALATNNVSGGLAKIGANTLTLTGANTYSGATLVSAGRLQLNGSAATGTPLATSGVTVGGMGTLGFTAAAISTLDLTGKSMTLSGGTLNFDIGASTVNDAITVQDFTITANSAITFNSLGGLSEGATYTLLTSTNPITNSGPFTLSGQTIGRVTLIPTINPNTITVTADVDESAWGVDSAGNWSLGTNWTGYLPGTQGDAALFGSVITAPRIVTVDTAQTVGFIRFNNANAYTIGANGSNFLTLNNGGSNALVTVTSGSHTIAENVLLASNLVAVPAAATSLTMSGVVSGTSRNVTLNGAGMLELSGVNTYSGTTTVSNGTLTLSGNRTAAAGDVTVGNLNGNTGTLNVSNGAFNTGTFVLGTGNGTAVGIVNQSSGTLTLTGGTQLIMGNGGSGGTLAGAGGNGTYNLSGGTLTATATASRGVMLGTNDGGTSTFNLSGTGTLTLTGTSVLMVGRSDSPVVNTTNLFNQSGGIATVTNLTIGGAAAAATGLNSTFTVTGGAFSATAFNNLGAGNAGTVAINIGGTGQVTLPAFPTIRGTGTTTTITFDSTTGYLRPTATSTAYMPASTLTTAKLTANGAKIDTNGFDITIGQVLQDDSTLGTLTKNGLGNLTLSGVNTYTGTTTINAGTLTINEGSIATSSDIVNNAALAYALTTNARSYANPITGTGSLTKSGTNTLTLGGTNTYTGTTTVSGGTLTISGSTNTTAGNVSVGATSSPATLNITGTGSLTTTGTLNLGGATGNILTVQSGGSLSIASITNPFGSSYTVDGTLTSTGSWTVSTNRTADTFNGTGTITAAALTLGNATTGVNYTGSGTINLAGPVTVASNGASGVPFYSQSSGTLNAAGMLLGDNTTNTAGSRTFNLNGGRVNLGSGGIASTGTTTATRAVNLGAGTLGASADWSSSLAMTLTSATPGTTINTLDSVDNTTARTITLSGILSGTGNALTKAGDGTLILTAANTYTGATTINAGTLQLGDAGTTGVLAPTSAITNNGNLTINRTNTALQGTAFGSITGTGSLTQAGSGTTTLNAANTYTGNTFLNAGLINLAVAEIPGTSGPLGNQLANAAGTIVFGGGTLQYSATNQFDYSGRFSTAANQAYKVDTNAQNVIWATDLTSSNGTLTKSNTGTLTLSGASSYSGANTITGGTVQISAANNLGDGSATNTISLGAATLRSTSGTYDLGANRAITMSGAGTIYADAGTLTVSGSITNGANGLTLRGDGNIVVTGVIGAGATPTGGLTIGVNSATGGANVTLSGNNLFTGNVALPAPNNQPKATLVLTNSGALGVGPKTVTAAGGGEIHLQNGISFASNIGFTVSGVTSIWNDSGNNTIQGGISMTSGNGDTALTSTSGLLTVSGNISPIASGRNLRLRGNGDGLITGAIANGSTANMQLFKEIGTGTWTLTGANTYTGATTVSEGTLALVGGSQTSPITVSAGASLGFTLGSPTTSTSTFNLTNGTIKITGTPTLPSYTLITDSTGITGTPTLHTPIAGYSLVKQGNSLVLITPQGLYDTWKNDTFANAFTLNLPGQDQDTDTFLNVMEYAFGTDPTVNSSAPLTYSGGTLTSTGQPILVKEAGVWYAVFGRRKDYVEAGLTYTVEFSSSLAEWVDGVAAPQVIATDGTIDAVRVQFPNFVEGPSGQQKPTFFRVEVTSPY